MNINLLRLMIFLIITVASIRGAFIYHLNFSAYVMFMLSSVSLAGFGLFSLLSLALKDGNKALVVLKNVILVNALLFMATSLSYIVIDLATGMGEFSIGLVYFFLIFPIIFVLINYSTRWLLSIVYVVAAFTAFGVFYFLNLVIAGGFDEAQKALLILRPFSFRYSRIGENILPFGYTGSHHDTANILVMCAVFFLVQIFTVIGAYKKALAVLIYVLMTTALILTGSAANTLVFILMSMVVLFVYFKDHLLSFFGMIIAIFCVAVVVINLAGVDAEEIIRYGYVFRKLNPDNVPETMWAGLDSTSMVASMFSVFFGFGSALNSPFILSEVAFVSVLGRFGLLPFITLMFIGFSPLYYILIFHLNQKRFYPIKFNTEISPSYATQLLAVKQQKQRLMLLATPAIAGFMTLVHYGSLLRITSVALFCVLLTLFFKEYTQASQRFFVKHSR